MYIHTYIHTYTYINKYIYIYIAQLELTGSHSKQSSKCQRQRFSTPLMI